MGIYDIVMRLLTSPINRPTWAPCATFYFLLSTISSFILSLISSGYRTPSLVPTVCVLERTPTKCHPKQAQKGAPSRSLISSSQSSGPGNNPNNHPTRNFHRASTSNHRGQKPRRATTATTKTNGGACYEHIRANHSAPNVAARHRSSRTTTR
jgi:hypothetical protein